MWGQIERYDLKKRSIFKKEIVRWLHYIMLGFCALASIVIFFVGLLKQIVIASVLLAYGYYIYCNPYLIDLILGHLFQQSQYMIIRQPGSVQKQKEQNRNINQVCEPKKTKSVYYFDQNKSYSSDGSLINKSYELSNGNESSYSNPSYSLYCRNLNEKNREYREPIGFQFGDESNWKDQVSQEQVDDSSMQRHIKKMVFLSRHDIDGRMDKHLQQSMRLYEEDLKKYLRIHSVEQMEPKYKKIEVIINRLISQKINMLTIFQDKIQRFAKEYFNYSLSDFNEPSPSQIDLNYYDRTEPTRRNFWVFLFQVLQTQTQQFNQSKAERKLVRGKTLSMYGSMALGAIKETMKLSDLFGIHQMLCKLSKDRQIIGFLKNFTRIVKILNRYIQFLKNNRFEQEYSSQDIREQMVDRIFILNFFVREFNRGAQISVININDVWGFGSQIYDNNFLHIEIKDSFDRYYPHLNLTKTEKGKTKRWNCAPKLNNYTSIIYLMMHELNQSSTHMHNPYIFSMVRSIL